MPDVRARDTLRAVQCLPHDRVEGLAALRGRGRDAPANAFWLLSTAGIRFGRVSTCEASHPYNPRGSRNRRVRHTPGVAPVHAPSGGVQLCGNSFAPLGIPSVVDIPDGFTHDRRGGLRGGEISSIVRQSSARTESAAGLCAVGRSHYQVRSCRCGLRSKKAVAASLNSFAACAQNATTTTNPSALRSSTTGTKSLSPDTSVRAESFLSMTV